MHSPIMCISSGVPAVVCRFDEQTNKGFMWRDIGLDEWLFDLDQPAQVERIAATVVGIAKDPAAAQAKVRAAQRIVVARQDAMFAALGQSLTRATAA